MWLVTSDDKLINMGYVSLISINEIGGDKIASEDETDTEIRATHCVDLTFANSWEIAPQYTKARREGTASKGGSDQKTITLFEGSSANCGILFDRLVTKVQPKHNPSGMIFLNPLTNDLLE